MTSARIDDDVFPFSEAELGAALALVLRTARAVDEAARHSRELRAQRHSHSEFLASVAAAAPAPRTARTFPASDVPGFGVVTYVWPELDCLALLHALSPDVATRVDAHRARIAASDPASRWAHDFRLLDDAAWRRAQRSTRRLMARFGA